MSSCPARGRQVIKRGPKTGSQTRWKRSGTSRIVKGLAVQEEIRKIQKAQLTVAIARGESIAVWARQHRVPRSSAFRWAKEPKVRSAVEACRRRAINRAIGRMTSLALKAANGIARLAKDAESESVQLRAWRAILADQIAVSKFSDLEYRMVEIEEKLRDRTAQTDHAAYGAPGDRPG
jgi:hypothetical protein